MRQSLVILLTFAITCLGTGLAEWLHVSQEHSSAHLSPADESAATPHGDADGPDEAHCGVCLSLHAPLSPIDFRATDLVLRLAVDRVIALQAQRLDASIPAPRGCRGPPRV
jgi:hypothetical protein